MRLIKIRTEFEGYHQYKNAPKEVSFLRNLHRHLFGVSVKIQERDEDRELEFFIVKRKIQAIIKDFIKQSQQNESCEDMAEFVLDHIELDYPNRFIEVEVSEDGENSGIINNVESHE